MAKILIAVLALAAMASGAAIAPRALPFSKVLDEDGNFVLNWDIKSGPGELDLQIVANTTGWAALLFPSADGTYADLIWGGYDASTGSGYLADMRVNLVDGAHDAPVVDASSDVTLQDAVEEGGVTTLTFKRKINTGDADDVAITAGDVTVGWSWSDSDSAEVPHVAAGFTTVALIPGKK